MAKKKEELTPMTRAESDEKILQYINDRSNKDAQVIGLLAKAKKVVFENNVQLNRFYRRHLRAAKELDCYSNEKIIRVMKYLIDNANYKWELSTVIKHIDEDFNQLEGKEPIINLSDGEQVYSSERIKQLEREGRVYYVGSKWKEIVEG